MSPLRRKNLLASLRRRGWDLLTWHLSTDDLEFMVGWLESRIDNYLANGAGYAEAVDRAMDMFTEAAIIGARNKNVPW